MSNHRALRITSLALAACGLVLLPLAASAAQAPALPTPPPETEQFAFLVADHDCKTYRLGPDGKEVVAPAKWVGEYILDGWAIQDTWTQRQPSGFVFHGTNIRSFNPTTQVWDNRWLPIGSLAWSYYSSEMHGERMVMQGGEGEDATGSFVNRITFHSVSERGFEWFQDRSYDGGKTWNEKVLKISCRRSE